MDYSQALKFLFDATREGKIKKDLVAMHQLSQRIENPHRSFKSVHIAGTNGKGSVAFKIAKGLELSGYKTGLYTSPHISSFRERIQVNGKMISEEQILNSLNRLLLLGPASFFEWTTLIAFEHFAKEKVDFAVLETGLGGRLDATNIVLPELSVITSIALDHVDILGNTLEKIAAEKGGIIKPQTPILIGPRVPYDVISNIAERLKAPLTSIQGNFQTFDEENSAIAAHALKMLQIPSEIIHEAIQHRPPCRLEKIDSPRYPFPVILDAAHNPDGLTALFRSLENKLPVIVGLSKSKDLKSALRILSENSSHLYLVQAENSRAADTKTLSAILKELPFSSFTICPSIKDALDQVPSSPIICGTFFILAEAREALGLDYPNDN